MSMNGELTIVDLLRHGECQGGEVFRGATDLPLNDTGWQQMQSAVEELSADEAPWQQIITSPLSRCAAFAEQLATERNIPLARHDGLREIHFGHWEGREIAEVWQSEPNLIGRYFSEPGSVTPDGGEPLQSAQQRVVSAWQEIIGEHRGKHLLLVQHGGTIRLLLAELLQMPLSSIVRLSVGYAGLSRVHIYHDGDQHHPSLVFHRPTPSLPEGES